MIVLLPKPDAGFRPIGLLPFLPRLWMPKNGGGAACRDGWRRGWMADVVSFSVSKMLLLRVVVVAVLVLPFLASSATFSYASDAGWYCKVAVDRQSCSC